MQYCSVDPTSIISAMKKNYSEALEKTLRNSSFSLNEERSKASAAANEIGLREMMLSPSLHAFAQRVSGYELEDDPALQVIRYSSGDYVGPHNDHHPEEPTLRNGYVDLQITLSNDAVARQYLLYEAGDGYFNSMNNIGIASAVSVSKLPFWHQVTPLEAKPGREKAAVRWLLLASFLITQSSFAKKRGRRYRRRRLRQSCAVVPAPRGSFEGTMRRAHRWMRTAPNRRRCAIKSEDLELELCTMTSRSCPNGGGEKIVSLSAEQFKEGLPHVDEISMRDTQLERADDDHEDDAGDAGLLEPLPEGIPGTIRDRR